MATLELIDSHRLRSDSKQWILEKYIKTDDEGKDVWSNVFYYGTLTAAINGSYAYFLRKSDATNITEFMADSKRIFNKMVECLSPVADIREK